MGTTLQGVQLGYMRLDKEFLLFPHPERILHAGNAESPHIWYDCPALSYIIDTPDGKILWETGVSSRWAEEWPDPWKYLLNMDQMKPEVCLEARLKDLKLGPDDFKYVVMGHLHCDHAGGLRFFESGGAEILVHTDEWKQAQELEAAGTAYNHFFSPADFAVLKMKKPTLISGDQEILPGVSLVELPGHTDGTMGMMIQLEHMGTVLLTSDALYMHEAYGPPAVGSGVTYDTVKWRKSAAKIERLAKEHEAYLFPGHDETAVKQYKDHSEFREIKYWPNYVYE